MVSCGDDEPVNTDVMGCTDAAADNFNANANVDDGSCVYSGCTDPDAENFDSDATNDDGSCVYARDKFIGTYFSMFECPGLLASLSNDSLTVIIEPGLDPDEKNSIIVSIEIMGFPIPFRGTVSGDTLTIMDELKDATIPDLPLIGTITADVLGEGTATLSSDLNTLTGNVNLTISAAILPADIGGDCQLVGTRQ